MFNRELVVPHKYALGCRLAFGVYRRFKATRYAFKEAVALDFLRQLRAKNNDYTLVVRDRAGQPVTLRLKDFLSQVPTRYMWGKTESIGFVRIYLPFHATADADLAFLMEVQADIRYEYVAPDMTVTTYEMSAYVILAAAMRMQAAALTAHWKIPIGLHVVTRAKRIVKKEPVFKPIQKKEPVFTPSAKIIPRRPLYQPSGDGSSKETPA